MRSIIFRIFARYRPLACLCFLCIFFASAPGAVAAWTASGTFKYQDRAFDQYGFTGAVPLLPIRYAKVELRYVKGGGGSTGVLATGATDASGNYSLTVNDSQTRSVFIRVLTTSGVPDLFLQVTNVYSPTGPYAVTTPTYASHPPVDLDAGLITAIMGAGGEPFNLFDVGLNTIDYLAFLNGSRPGSSQELTILWDAFGGVSSNSYIGNNTVRAADNSGYNDTVIQHETGHYAVANFSASDNPGGVHHLTNCRQDLRLAFDEGFATFFGQEVRRHFNLPHPQLYVKTTGAAGPGHLDFYFDVEDEVPFTCKGSASEVAVYSTLWDLTDDASTADNTPGQDESWDTLSEADSLVWNVMRGYIPSALNKSVEDFWDGWFTLGEGSEGSMQTVFVHHGMEFVDDLAEDNDTPTTAMAVLPNGSVFHATYFKDTGTGAGSPDTDYFKFEAQAGVPYRIETVRLLGDANTSLVLLKSDGVTPVASNDDRSAYDPSSLIEFTAPENSTYYVKSFHGPGLGIYGSYDFAIVGGDFYGGSDYGPGPELPTLLRRRSTLDGQTPGGRSGYLSFPE